MADTGTAGFPLSVQQRRIWASGPGSTWSLRALRLSGELDPETLRRALDDLVQRHEILRTRFARTPGLRLPLQVITDEPRLHWQVLSPDGDEGLHRTVSNVLEQEVFDPEADSPVRAWLVTLESGEHGLVLAVSALCADRQSLDVIVEDLGAAYAAARGAGQPERGEPVQYVDFAGWQESLGDDDSAREAAGFWRERVEAARATGPLPLERPALEGSFSPTQISTRLDANAADYLAPCWHALLWRFDQPSRVAVGHVFDGRPLDELQGAVGPYAHALPVVSEIKPGMAVGRLCEQFSADVEEAHSRQQYYGVGAASDHAEAVLPWQFEWLAPRSTGRWDGVALEAVGEAAVGQPHTMKLSCRPEGDAIEVTLSYDGGRLGEAAAGGLLEAFAESVRAAAEAPETPVDELPLIPAPARREALAAREELPGGEPEADTLVEAIREQARRTPEAVAVEFGARRRSYAELIAAATGVAAALAGHGVGRDVRVGICLERSEAYVTAIVGTMLAGGCYVPLDPDYPPRYATRILADAGAAVLITQPSMRDRFAGAGIPLVVLDPEARAPEASKDGFEPPQVGPEDLAYAIYTSGSTGDPKGVMITQGSAVSLARALGRTIYAGEEGRLRVSVNAPFTFDASVKQIVQLTRGHTVHVLPTDIRLDAHELSDHLEHNRVDVLDCTPSQLRPLLNAIEIHEQRSYPRIVLVGGEPVGQDLWTALRADELIETWNVYGPTEATVDATVAAVRRSGEAPTIGRPLPGAQALVLDAALQPVPAGVLGELCLGGWGVSRGYLRAPELTAESFVDHPEIAGERLFRTGDLARLNTDGTIDYVGRRDRQVKIRGFRIGLAEIEAAIARHDGVREAAVVDVTTGAGTKRLAAFVVPSSGDGDALIDSLRAHAEAELPEHMRPASYEPIDALPMTSHGKVDLSSLREQAAQRLEAGRTYDPPRTDTEKLLTDIWAKALEADRVGINDDFFELGGDSILQILVVARAKEEGLDITPRDLFEHPTVAELAGVCDGAPS